MSEAYDPQWTEPDYPWGSARDALRTQAAGDTILEDLLPGINTVTQRARYYSFWAWVLYEFINADLPGHTQRDFYEWLRPKEAMLILGYLSHGHKTGAVGTDQGHEVWQNGERDFYPLNWKSLGSVNGGAYQANYSGALEDMNIVAGDTDPSHSPVLKLQKPMGVRLAEAYARAVGNAEYRNRYWHADRVPRSVVEDFASVGCLCEASRFPEERQALIDAFFRFDTVDTRARRRLDSLGLFLDIVDQARGMPLDERSMRAVLYFRSYGTDHVYAPRGNLTDPADRWRVFQLRQYYVFAVECLWTLFLARIRNRSRTPEEYLDWLFGEVDLDALGERYGVRWPTRDLSELTLGQFHDALEDAEPAARFGPGTSALNDGLNEHALYVALAGRAPDEDANRWAGNGLLMLGLLRRRCQGWREDAGWSAYAGGGDHLSIDAYLAHVRRATDEGWTMARWLSWLHERYLWLRHRQVALEKMMVRGRDPVLFEWEEGRFRGLGEDRPKMNNPRFANTLRILEDLELVRRESAVDWLTYSLTPDGADVLQRFREHEPGS